MTKPLLTLQSQAQMLSYASANRPIGCARARVRSTDRYVHSLANRQCVIRRTVIFTYSTKRKKAGRSPVTTHHLTGPSGLRADVATRRLQGSLTAVITSPPRRTFCSLYRIQSGKGMQISLSNWSIVSFASRRTLGTDPRAKAHHVTAAL